jgi:hypothetical protein
VGPSGEAAAEEEEQTALRSDAEAYLRRCYLPVLGDFGVAPADVEIEICMLDTRASSIAELVCQAGRCRLTRVDSAWIRPALEANI